MFDTSERLLNNLQLMEQWKFWSQTLQDKCPTPVFLSILAVTAFSWLQKRHGNEVASGSAWSRYVRNGAQASHGVVYTPSSWLVPSRPSYVFPGNVS